MLARAIGELGRIPKTLHLLAYIDDESLPRRILTQLNRGEGRHAWRGSASSGSAASSANDIARARRINLALSAWSSMP